MLKSSEKAPLAAARVAELVAEAGFPPGVFNIISGHDAPSGAAIAEHADVRAHKSHGLGPHGAQDPGGGGAVEP